MSGNNRLSVLVVEDNPVVASQLTSFLGGLGWTVDFAASGQRAMHFGRAQRYDVVLLDAQLPDMQGAELCKVLKHEQKCCLSVVLMDTQLPAEIRTLEVAPDIDDVVTDPSNYKDVVARCQAVARKQAMAITA